MQVIYLREHVLVFLVLNKLYGEREEDICTYYIILNVHLTPRLLNNLSSLPSFKLKIITYTGPHVHIKALVTV